MGHGLRAALGHENRRALAWPVRNTTQGAGSQGGDGGGAVPLTNIEYRLLSELSVNAGRALTHDQLLQRVWGPDKGEDSGPVRNAVKRLRRKLGEDASNPASIFAVPRVGYRMEKGEEQEGA